MNRLAQALFSAIPAVVAFYLLHMFLRIVTPDTFPAWLPQSLAVVIAAMLGYALWNQFGSDEHGLLGRMVQGAFFVGGVAFLAGFIGPMIFSPDSNQGPMLGIFVTGPLGTVFGAIGGFIFWYFRDRTEQPPSRTASD